MLEAARSMVVGVDNSTVPFSEESSRVGKIPLGPEGACEKQDVWREEALKQAAWLGPEARHNSEL